MTENQYAVTLDNVSMHFNMSSEKIDSLKEYFLKMVKGQLNRYGFGTIHKLFC